MRGSKSSAVSPRSSLAAVAKRLAAIALLLGAIGAGAAWWCFAHGYSLYYGDAEAHLNIARRILAAQEIVFKAGLTGIHDASVSPRAEAEVYRALDREAAAR